MPNSTASAACRTDKASLSNMADFEYQHLNLALVVDFEAKCLRGTATWTVLVKKHRVQSMILDTSSGLRVTEVAVCDVPTTHEMKPAHAAFGSACVIPVPDALSEEGTELKVKLEFATSPESSALQWLPPEQTAGKERPYMFSQCQAIHARALLPCPDAPSSKFTYDATVRVPDWATALMSAVSMGSPKSAIVNGFSTRTFDFEQRTPVPSYLVAIAVGELRGIDIGPRSTVWAEPAIVEAAAWEFGQAEEFILAGEELLDCPYNWGKYDILCMPPSFPFGGMENPCLTFATPTLLAGDRSLAGVICHEVAHSWTGNLVTNHTWEHFWLNEGWTRWVENRILTKLDKENGEELYDFLMHESQAHLDEAIRVFGPDNQLTALVPNCDGIDPDDAFSAVPYEKGLAFLNYLASIIGGRQTFEEFGRAYIREFKFHTLTSAEFRAFFLRWCEKRQIDASAVDWDAWFYTPGKTPVTMTYGNKLGGACDAVSELWLQEFAASDAAGKFTAAQWEAWPSKLKIHFLETLLAKTVESATPPLSSAALLRMDALYGLSKSKNSEVRARWQRICIGHRMEFIVPHVIAFVKEAGRMKFVRPLYRELYAWESFREQAVSTFQEWRSNYHPIAAKMLAKDLKVEP